MVSTFLLYDKHAEESIYLSFCFLFFVFFHCSQREMSFAARLLFAKS